MEDFVSDYTKSPEQIVIDLINNNNPAAYPMTTELVTLSHVTSLDGDKYTSVKVTAKAGSGFKGSQTFAYNRIRYSDVPGSRSKLFQIGEAETLSELVPLINAAYEINLTANDFVNLTIPPFPGLAPHENQQINLTAKPGSLVYVGTLALTILANDLDLSEALFDTDLDGLIYTPPVVVGVSPSSEGVTGSDFVLIDTGDGSSGAVVDGDFAL